jgi:hypothetical protein
MRWIFFRKGKNNSEGIMRRMRTYARFANVGAFWSQTLEKIQIKSRRKNVLVSFFKSELSALIQTPFG